MAIDPYKSDLSHKLDCPCEECQIAREFWASNQPALSDYLNSQDSEENSN